MSGTWELIDLYPGAHIRVKCGSYYHHGIYIGDGEVVQFGLPDEVYSNPKEVKVLRSTLAEFCGSAVFIEVYKFTKKELKEKRSDEVIIQTALSCVGDGGYNLLHNNCEHFANKCIFGVNKSSQIDEVYANVAKMLKL